MYPLQIAASMLGVSTTTVHRWIAQASISTVTIETDRKRRYISQQDLINLAVIHQRKIGNLNEITNRPKNHPDPELYTLVEVAQFLDVSLVTVRAWLIQANIEKRYIATDRKRIYLTDRDIAVLIYNHRWNKKYGHNTNPTSPIDQIPHNLCTLRDAARYLRVNPNTVRKWLDQYNINKTILTSKKRIYIEQCDLLRLADLHPKKPITLDLCTIKEAARYLGVPRTTIEVWLVRHHITKHIIGSTGQRVYIHYTDVIKLEHLHPGGPADKTLLTIQEVAQYLGVSTDLIRDWLIQHDIPKHIIGTTGQRTYIHCTDLVTLKRLHPDKSTYYRELLTLKDAAAHLGISTTTLLRWFNQHDLPTYSSGANKHRTYVHHADVAKLEHLRPVKPAEQDLWTTTEVAQYLGVSKVVVRKWLTQHDIPKHVVGITGRRIY